eukprot:gene795-184_t
MGSEYEGKSREEVIKELEDAKAQIRGLTKGKCNLAHGGNHFYEGDMVVQREGFGKYTRDDGIVYEGDWKNNLRHGQGTISYRSGAKYAGGFSEDKEHDKGKLTYPSGDVYDGLWERDQKHGQGKYTWVDDEVYDGQAFLEQQVYRSAVPGVAHVPVPEWSHFMSMAELSSGVVALYVDGGVECS